MTPERFDVGGPIVGVDGDDRRLSRAGGQDRVIVGDRVLHDRRRRSREVRRHVGDDALHESGSEPGTNIGRTKASTAVPKSWRNGRRIPRSPPACDTAERACRCRPRRGPRRARAERAPLRRSRRLPSSGRSARARADPASRSRPRHRHRRQASSTPGVRHPTLRVPRGRPRRPRAARAKWSICRAPVASVARPAVDEHQRRRALALDLEVHRNAVSGVSDVLHRAATWRPRPPGSP